MKIFTQEFNELIKRTELELSHRDTNTISPLLTVNELYNGVVTDEVDHEYQVSDLYFNAGSVAAVARSRQLKKDAVIGWTRRHQDWLIWAERVEYPQSLSNWGFVHATVLTENGKLENVNRLEVKPSDIPSGYINNDKPKELSSEQLFKILGRAGSRTTEVNLGASDLSYETHIQHLATWVVKNGLHIPKSSDAQITPYTDTWAGYLALEDDITNGVHRT